MKIAALLVAVLAIAAPAWAQCIKTVHVDSYHRTDGTFVREHMRSRPGTAQECAEQRDEDGAVVFREWQGTASFEVSDPYKKRLDAPAFGAVCVTVVDGDTLDLKAGATTYRVRLRDIDAPELAQAFGPEAKAALAKRCTGRLVSVAPAGRDRWGRMVAAVDVAGVDLSQAMVGSGLAWSYGPAFDALETTARGRMAGLWASGGQIAPWTFRAEAGQ